MTRYTGKHADSAGRAHPVRIFTSNRAFPRASRRTAGRLVLALDAFLRTGEAAAGSTGSSSPDFVIRGFVLANGVWDVSFWPGIVAFSVSPVSERRDFTRLVKLGPVPMTC